MGYSTKVIIFSLLFVGTFGRFLVHNNNSLDSIEELEITSEESSRNSSESLSEPQGTNSTDSVNGIECNCNWRYFKHYEVKGCYVEQFDSCSCPKKFRCPENETLQAAAKVCVYQNKEYQVGSKIIIPNTCQVCRCRHGDSPFMSCTAKECPPLDPPPGENCHLVYKENVCCPVEYECIDSESEERENIESCEYNGVLYPFGSKIYPQGNPCQVCICDENWNGTNNSNCYLQECVLEQKKFQLEAGCVPVYHENRCCPIEFYCPSTYNFSYALVPTNNTEDSDIFNGDKCLFGDQLFDLGTEVRTDNPCVTCTCSVPPDFSCIHQSCPPPPNSENCYPVYNPLECCPLYDCLMGDVEPESEGCPTPICADSSCYIGVPPGHECPTCICGERVSELEHNDLQQHQQIQQIGQNFEPLHEMYEGQRAIVDDYSEDELQMMPIRVYDSEGQSSVMEKIILPEFEGVEHNPEEELRELVNISAEEISDTKPISSKEVSENTDRNIEHLVESELNETNIESNENYTGREIKKRSDITDAPYYRQYQIHGPFVQVPMGHVEMEGGEIEREGEDSKNHGGFDDELESFKNKLFANNNTIINEIISINHEVPVPAGCPTPMCEGPWCRVGIPAGHRCPTCICKRKIDSEP